MATYAAMVDRMDQNVGRVLRTLAELGIEENTIVIFLSDNGGCTEEPGGRDDTQQPGIVSTYTTVGPAWGFAQNTPFRRYKSWTNEGGISTPFLVRWPAQVTAGSRTNQVAHLIDVLPTCLEAAGAKPLKEIRGAQPPPLEGHSLIPVLRGGVRETPTQLFWEWAGNLAVREGRWKAVWDTENPAGKWQLYDIDADRTEMNDLAGQRPELVERLSTAYERWARNLGRGLPGERS
jgi:arylsulfatase